MFTTSVGTPLDASHVRRDFRALCKKAGIEGAWPPRELRHTFVSVMSVSGVAVEEIARLAGHTSSRTTETIYRYDQATRDVFTELLCREYRPSTPELRPLARRVGVI